MRYTGFLDKNHTRPMLHILYMYTEKNYHVTTPQETVLPITYIESYADANFKYLIHTYKFTKKLDRECITAKRILTKYLEDICFDATSTCQTMLYTCPPSTMYARKEKREDSMRELFRNIRFAHSHIFSIQTKYLIHTKAQHLSGNRTRRISDLHSRYAVSHIFKLQLWYMLTFFKKQTFSFCIVDDISSTGGTLLACKDTLDTYMRYVQQKHPHIFWDIQVFSIGH